MSAADTLTVRPCPYCAGAGATAGCTGPLPCEECDGTGRKYRAIWTTEDGLTCSMSGSGHGPDDESRMAMEMFARAAISHCAAVSGSGE